MFHIDYQAARALMDLRVEKALSEADVHLLRQQAELQLGQVAVQKQGWLRRQSGWLVRQLGHRLVAWGQRLQSYGLPQSLPLEGQMSCKM